MSDIKPPVPELCSAYYSAVQVPIPDGARQVFILAQEEHVTSGYTVHFTQSPLDIFPPQFAFWHIKPTGIVLEMITPFSKFTSFNAEDTVKEVVVRDAEGEHRVVVEQIGDMKKPDLVLDLLAMAVGKDGPFPTKDGPFPRKQHPAAQHRH